MEELAIPGTEININLLDNLLTLFLKNGENPKISNLLNNFISREDLYIHTDKILMSNCLPASKFFFLKGLNAQISTKWPIIPEEFQQKNRQSIINFISQPYDAAIQSVLTKAFESLSEILKFDLDQKWPDFFDVFYNFTSNSPVNGLNFISFFAQEIMNYSENVMTSDKASELMGICNNQLGNILTFSYSILQENLDNSIVIKSALPTFGLLVKWLPVENFIGSPILSLIIENFINNREYALESCQVLIEFMKSANLFPEFLNDITRIFVVVIETLHRLCNGDYLSFPRRIADLFLLMMDKCLSSFVPIFNQPNISAPLQIAYSWLMDLTMNPYDDSIQESCYSVWMNSYNKILMNNVIQETQTIFSSFMAPLRRAIIANIPQPYKIDLFIDDFDNEIRVFQVTASSNPFSVVHDCLVFLSKIDNTDTINAFNERLDQGESLSIADIQKVGFAIAATAGVFDERVEDAAILPLIQRFFSICQMPNPNVDAVEGGRMRVACSLIYMCSHYYSIMNRFNQILKAILQLIMKFFVEGDFELQAVSINSLKTIAQRCKNMISFPIENDSVSFLSVVLSNSERIFASMATDNIVELFRVLSIMIRVHNDEQTRIEFLSQLMAGINKLWAEKIMSDSFNPYNVELLHLIELVLMCHSSILLSLSSTYSNILKDFLPQLVSLMQLLTAAMPNAPSPEILNSMKSAKSQIFFLLFRFCYFCYRQEFLIEIVVPISFQPILDDYVNSDPNFRLMSSLKFFTALFNRCIGTVEDTLLNAYDSILNATMPVISNNFSDFMDIRIEFFNLTASVVHQHPKMLVAKDPGYIEMLINTLKFGAKHPRSPISGTAIELISDLFISFKSEMPSPETYAQFFDHFCIDIVQLFFNILTDLTYKFAFSQLSMSIKNFFSIENMKAKAGEVFEFLCQMFPSVQPSAVMDLVQTLVDSQSFAKSKVKLRDFILIVKIVRPNDPDLYKQEIGDMKQALNKPFLDIAGQIDQIDENEDIKNQLLQIQSVPPSSQLIDELASISIRHQG